MRLESVNLFIAKKYLASKMNIINQFLEREDIELFSLNYKIILNLYISIKVERELYVYNIVK